VVEKAGIPVDLLGESRGTSLTEAWFEIVHLKQVYRKGWLQRGIAPELCETVADHSFGNAILCLLLLPEHPELDPYKVLKLALIHDLGEAYVGDITPQDNVDPAVKSERESAAIDKILSKLPGGEDLVESWHEYENQQTAESKFVKQIDRLEFAMQAGVYGQQGRIDPSEFFDAVAPQLKSEALQRELSAIRALVKK